MDNNILKLDTIHPDYIQRVDRPAANYDVARIISDMKRFKGHLIIQTMFMHGSIDGEDVGNTAERYVAPWLEAVRLIQPAEVMIYTIDRPTPDTCLQKATPLELDAIRRRVENMGIACTASY